MPETSLARALRNRGNPPRRPARWRTNIVLTEEQRKEVDARIEALSRRVAADLAKIKGKVTT